jgi:uncharacterized protein (DUF488 family)
MLTSEFTAAFADLLSLARERSTAIMCAESLWWQCHRRLIADALLAAGNVVMHIESATKVAPHRFIAPAHLRDGKLSYVAEQSDLDLHNPG